MGFSPVFVREAEVGAFASAFWRVLFALPPLFLWAWMDSQKSGRIFVVSPTAILAGVFFSCDLVFWHLSILNTTMANATFMVCLSPVWVAVVSPLLLGEKTENNALAGLGLCLLGLGCLIGSSFQIDPSRLIGDLYGLITSVFLGLYFVAMRHGRQTEKSGVLFFTSTVVTCLVLFLVALLASGDFYPETGRGWASLVSLGVVTHAGGQGLVTLAIGSLSAVFSSLVIFIEAIAAAFFGWLLFEEGLSPLQWAGCFLILFGIWICRPRPVHQN